MKKLTAYDYLTIKKELIDLGFSVKEIKKAISDAKISVSDLTSEKPFITEPTYFDNYEVIKQSHRYTDKEYRGSYSRDVEVNGILCRVASDYQSLQHGILIHKLLSNRFDWFNSFSYEVEEETKVSEFEFFGNIKDIPKKYDNYTIKQLKNLKKITVKKSVSFWKIYSISNSDSLIYLETGKEHGSLYVPIKALLNKDFNAIIDKTINYAKSYTKIDFYKQNAKNYTKSFLKEKEDFYNQMIAGTKSDIAEDLKQYLNS